MERCICIHGHFYQPPRENPWLEAVELQDSAAPYHDWNERITAECYAPNATARMLDGEGRIAQIINNYSKISFNFGPTLLAWMKDKTLDVLAELGIKFTILSPFQASRMREINARGWRDVNGARIDPTRPYVVRLPSGRTITAFFYDAPVSQAVAFEKLLEQGDRLAQR